MKARTVYMIVVGLAAMMPLAASAYVLLPYNWNYLGGWPVTVDVMVNPNCADPLVPGVLPSLQAALNTWTAAGANFAFNYAGPTSTVGFNVNGQNEVSWSNNGGGNFATTAVWYNGSNMTEADVVFWDEWNWATSMPSAQEVDVESVGLHEFGHVLGLDHSQFNWAVMWGTFGLGEMQRELSQDDVDGIIAIYGNYGTEVSGNVTGTWTTANSPYHVIGGITVPSGQYLIIEPGVDVVFDGHYYFYVTGLMLANGSVQDSIMFAAANLTEGWAGLRISGQDASILDYCIIKNVNNPMEGGAIGAWNSNLVIKNCTITDNHAGYWGGAISCVASPTIINCIISGNSAQMGGGIACNHYAPIIRNCLLLDNSAYTQGGGIYAYYSSANIINTLITENSAPYNGGAGIMWEVESIYDPRPIIINSIIWANLPDQIYPYNIAPYITYSNVQGGIYGQGNINSNPFFVSGPGGNFYLSQTASGQPLQSPCVDAGDPASQMMIGTTRTDGVLDAGRIDMGYHYEYQGLVPNTVTVTLDPVSSPIVIPADGGSFQYNITLHNYTASSQTFNFWCSAQVPGGYQFTTLGPFNVTLPAGGNLIRLRTQNVPAQAPGGYYLYWGFAGTYPWNITASDNFPFTKEGAQIVWLGSEGWKCSGEPLPGEMEAGEATEGSSTRFAPTEFALHPCSPNPFNAMTTIRFDLPVAGWVKLEVFDVSGRNMLSGSGATPTINGWRSAGTHEVTFDASALAAGVYIARLQAGDFTASQKLVLLK